MKKLTTKLLMSIIAVAFAFVALGTSTYAWFAMNNSVEVKGLSLEAKADNTFLLISKTAAAENATTAQHAEAIQTENKIEVDFDMATADAQLYPVTWGGGNTLNINALNTATNWKVAKSDDPTKPEVDADQTALAANADLTKYVLTKTVYVTVAKDAVAATNLKVSQLTLPANTGIKAFIATSTAGTAAADSTVLADSISDSTVIQVNIYLYFDGTDANVYQTNLANLKGTVGFKLSVD